MKIWAWMWRLRDLFAGDNRQCRLEAVLLANLRHAHLPRVTDHFVIDNQGQYLIMDYIEGEDLRQRMERLGFISEQEALLVGVAMCDALDYLHTRKPSVIHRDVKPGNVRIAPDGRIYLVDFGLAKLVKGSQATTTGPRAMTPGYSPPEQYGTARTDPRTDVYSLGATLYAALTGVIPEDGLARAMDNVDLTPLRKRNPNISRKLASAIEKAMAVRRRIATNPPRNASRRLSPLMSRLKSSRAILLSSRLLRANEAGEDAKLAREMPPPESEPPAVKPPSRRAGKSAGVRLVGFLFPYHYIAYCGSGFGGYFWTPISKTLLAMLVTPTPTTEAVALNSPLPLVNDPVAVERTSTPTPTHKAVQPLSSLTPTHAPTATELVLPSITPTNTTTVTPTSTPVGGGSGQLAFASDQTGAPQIFIVNIDSSGMQQVTNMPDGACQPDWSPDGSRIVFVAPCLERKDEYPGARLYIINADGNNLLDLPFSEEGDFDPAWSPDGQYIAFTSLRDGSAQIYSMKLPEYTVTQLTQASTDAFMPDQSYQPSWSPDGGQIVYTGHSRLTDAPQIWVMS